MSEDVVAVSNDNTPKKLQQLGLTCKNGEQMEAFADRVSEYNKEKGFLAVELEATEKEDGTWSLVLYFRARSFARDFWTDPKYQTQILT